MSSRRAGVARCADAHAIALVGQDRHALLRYWLLPDRDAAAVDVDKGIVGGGQRLLEDGACGQVHIEIQRLRVLALHGAGHALARAGDDPHRHAAAAPFGHLCRLQIAVPGRAHLVLGRQVEPELKALHQALGLLRQFTVDHAATGGHPLHAAALQQPLVAGRVAMAHAPGEHVGHGLEAAVRVVGEAGDVIVGRIAAERVEHQERVEPVLQVLRQHPGQLDTGAVAGGATGDQAFDAARCDHGREGGGSVGGRFDPCCHCRRLARGPDCRPLHAVDKALHRAGPHVARPRAQSHCFVIAPLAPPA